MKVIILITIIIISFFVLQKNNKEINKVESDIISEGEFPTDSYPRGEPFKILEKVNNLIDPKEKLTLSQTLNQISSADKVTLNNVTKKWTLNKDLIDVTMNDKVTKIIQKIIEGVGYFSKNNYYIKTIENIYVMKDKDNNMRCILNCFIYDVKNYHTIKLIIDFVVFEQITYINFMDIDESGLKNIMQHYDFKYKSQGILNDHDTFDENIQILLDTYYKDKYKIIPLVSHQINDQSGTFTFDQLTQRLLPANVPINNKSPFFCNKESLEWDTKSIPSQTNEDCMFNNPSVNHQRDEPFNIPGTIVNNVDENQYSWLKNPVERVSVN